MTRGRRGSTLFAAVYLLWMVQRVVFGMPAAHERNRLVVLNGRVLAMMTPLVIVVFWIGLFPNPFLSRMHASVAKLLNGQTDVLEAGMTPVHLAELEVKTNRSATRDHRNGLNVGR